MTRRPLPTFHKIDGNTPFYRSIPSLELLSPQRSDRHSVCFSLSSEFNAYHTTNYQALLLILNFHRKKTQPRPVTHSARLYVITPLQTKSWAKFKCLIGSQLPQKENLTPVTHSARLYVITPLQAKTRSWAKFRCLIGSQLPQKENLTPVHSAIARLYMITPLQTKSWAKFWCLINFLSTI